VGFHCFSPFVSDCPAISDGANVLLINGGKILALPGFFPRRVGREAARLEAGTWTVPFRSVALPCPLTQNFDFLDEIKGLRGKNRPERL